MEKYRSLLPSSGSIYMYVILFCFISLLRYHEVSASSAAGQETLIGIVGRDFIMLGADTSSSSSIAVTASNIDKIAVLADPFPFPSKQDRESTEQQTIVAAAAGNAADADRLLGVLQAHVAVREYEASVGCDVQCVFHGSTYDHADSFNDPDKDFDTPMGLDAESVAYCARKEIATALRSPTPFQLCLLIAGMVQTAYPNTMSSSFQHHMKHLENPNEIGNSSFSNRIRSQIRLGKQQIKSLISQKYSRNDEQQTTHEQNSLSLTSQSSLLEPRLIWIDEYGSIQALQYAAHGYGANFALSILDQGFKENMTRSEALELMTKCFEQLRMRYVINSPQPPCIKCIDKNGCRLMR